MRRGLLLAFSSSLFVLISYFAHLWLSVLSGFPAEFSTIVDSKLTSSQVLADKPVAQQVFFILYDEEALPPENGAYFQVRWPETPGYYTQYVMLITGAPPEMAGVYFSPRPVKVSHLLEEMANSGRRIAFSGPGWWKKLLEPSADNLYASFFAPPDRYGEIIPQGARFASLFYPDFLFLHIPPGGGSIEKALSSLNFNVSHDLVAILTPSYFVLFGNGVIPGKYGQISALDIAPTLSALTGSSIPAAARGFPALNALLLPDEIKALKFALLARQRVSLADLCMKRLMGVGLDEGVKNDASLALESLELGNAYAALELAKLSVEEADKAMDKAMEKAIAYGRWRRFPFFLLWVFVPPLLLFLRRRPSALMLLIASLLSFTLNAWLFRQEWPYFSWEAVAHAAPSLTTLKRTLLSFYAPALLPLLWLLLEKEEDLLEAGETLACYGLWVLYFTSLPLAFCFLMVGTVPVYFLPPLGFYVTERMGLWQLFINGLVALPLPFLGMGIFIPFRFAAFKLHWRD